MTDLKKIENSHNFFARIQSSDNRLYPNLNPDRVCVWVFRLGLRLSGCLNYFGFGQPSSNIYWTIRFMCNLGRNSLKKFIKIISSNWVQTLKNQVQVWSHKILFRMSKNHITSSDIQITGSGHRTSGSWNGLTRMFDL